MIEKKNLVGIVLVVLSLVMVILGIYRGEIAVVLEKASRICMECIGIG
ncbi:MAG: hypothetical protein II098_07205 [Treponema sp.]|jgi:hypothetical protein|nr:hypothetical protein [Treponema sp.]